jgi:hypothetical protein
MTDCSKKYSNQTAMQFANRFNEHVNPVESCKNKSKFAQHLLDNGHNAIDPILKNMNVLNSAKKGNHMKTMENTLQYMHIGPKNGTQVNETCTISANALFDTLAQHAPAQMTSTVSHPAIVDP